jgi:gamma-glutamyltranspeptidase/glutathione hydrolase
VLFLESGVCTDAEEGLKRRGHNVRRSSSSDYGGYQIVRRTPEGVLWGGSEMRKDGASIGF